MFEVTIFEKEVEVKKEQSLTKERAVSLAIELTGKFKRFTRIDICEDGVFWKGYGNRDILIQDIWNEFLAVNGEAAILENDWFIFKKGTRRDEVVTYFNALQL